MKAAGVLERPMPSGVDVPPSSVFVSYEPSLRVATLGEWSEYLLAHILLVGKLHRQKGGFTWEQIKCVVAAQNGGRGCLDYVSTVLELDPTGFRTQMQDCRRAAAAYLAERPDVVPLVPWICALPAPHLRQIRPVCAH